MQHADIPITHKEPIHSVVYNHSFKQVVTCSDGSIIKLWDYETGNSIFEFGEAHGEAPITCMTFDNTGRRWVIGRRALIPFVCESHRQSVPKIFALFGTWICTYLQISSIFDMNIDLGKRTASWASLNIQVPKIAGYIRIQHCGPYMFMRNSRLIFYLCSCTQNVLLSNEVFLSCHFGTPWFNWC